jgi:HlyD family secretion protein
MMETSAQRPWVRFAWIAFLILMVCGAVVLAAVFFYPGKKEAARPAGAGNPQNAGVSCLGRIEPQGGVIDVAAPYFESRPSVVRELHVREGDWVKQGQILAVLDGNGPVAAALRLSEARLEVARNRLAQVKAGAKPADIEAQRAEVARRESELRNAEAEDARYEKLFATQDVSPSQRDEKHLALERAQKALDEAKEKLKSVSQVRPEDVTWASSEVDAADAEVRRNRAELELTVVRAPFEGQVLKVRVHPGEQAGAQPVLELGKTDRMYVSAEVYETDIGRVHAGQRATITSNLFPGELHGTVEQIGAEVAKSEVLPEDPVAFSDARIVKVKIRLDDSKPVAGLIRGRVNVVIRP